MPNHSHLNMSRCHAPACIFLVADDNTHCCDACQFRDDFDDAVPQIGEQKHTEGCYALTREAYRAGVLIATTPQLATMSKEGEPS